MNYISYNLTWMILNVSLSLVPVIISFVLEKKISKFTRYLLLLIWFLYLPNSIYLLTDIQYFPDQFIHSDLFEKIALIFQYFLLMLLGVATYMVSLKPIENIFRQNKKLFPYKNLLYIALNFIVSFAVVLGKFKRTHSWYIIADPIRVLNDILSIVFTIKYLYLVLLFGIVVNLIYFCSRKYFLNKK